MDFGSINWLAVVVSVIVNVFLGSIWYHPAVFYKRWLATMGKSWEDRPRGPVVMLYVFTVIAAVVETVSLAFVLNALHVTSAGGGAATGFMIWLGFVATTYLTNKLFNGQGWVGWLIEAGYHLVYLVIAGAILGAWH